jgi:hypothetical protein
MPNASTDLRQPAAQGPERLDRSRFLPKNRKRLSAPGMRTFLAIADLWGLNVGQRRLILGYPARSTFHKWAKTAREHGELVLDVDTLTRISAVLGITGPSASCTAASRKGLLGSGHPTERPSSAAGPRWTW